MKVIANIRIKYNNERYDKGEVINMRKEVAEKFIKKGHVVSDEAIAHKSIDIDEESNDELSDNEDDEFPSINDEEE